MLYRVTSGILFGGFMYYLGNIGALNEIFDGPQKRKTGVQEITLEPSHQKQSFIQKIKYFVTDTGVKFTFPEDAISITPTERHINLNQRIKIIYSTLHKAPLSVHQIIDQRTVTFDQNLKQNRDDKWYFLRGFSSQQQQKLNIPSKFTIKSQHYELNKRSQYLNLDKGHMASAANYNLVKQLMQSTFSYANSIPQNKNNNRGIWRAFETYCRDLIKKKKCESVEIISGPIFNSDKLSEKHKEYKVYENNQYVIQKNGIVIPPRLYKIIKCNTYEKSSYASGFIFNNQQYKNYKMGQFQTQIPQIQSCTGLLFDFKGKLVDKLTNYDKEKFGQNIKSNEKEKQVMSDISEE